MSVDDYQEMNQKELAIQAQSYVSSEDGTASLVSQKLPVASTSRNNSMKDNSEGSYQKSKDLYQVAAKHLREGHI